MKVWVSAAVEALILGQPRDHCFPWRYTGDEGSSQAAERAAWASRGVPCSEPDPVDFVRPSDFQVSSGLHPGRWM